ncbi:MAG: flagellar hook-associated protein FlgL [Myxococcales bacterium]|nr:flagellar hook-associated protein FlgL [Myxococcales bacterium]
MRITNTMMYRFGVHNAQEQRARLAEIQERASTLKDINRPSDDPVGVRAVTLIRDGLAQIAQFRQNITSSRLRVSTTEAAIDGTYQTLVRARVLAIQGANGTQDSNSRKLLAQEIVQLHGQLMRESNLRDSGGGRVFAGFATDADPFAVSGAFVSGSPAPTVTFSGDTNEIRIAIDEGVDLQVTLRGDRVFSGAGGGENLFEIIEDLWTALDTNDQAAVAAITDRINTALNELSAERTSVGASATQAELWERRHIDRDALLQEQLSQLENADSIEVFSSLVQQEAALRGSIEVTSRILQTNLLSFL